MTINIDYTPTEYKYDFDSMTMECTHNNQIIQGIWITCVSCGEDLSFDYTPDELLEWSW